MIKLKLNGWMRLYVTFAVIWVLFTLFSFFTSLSNINSLPDPGQLARIELLEEIQKVQSIKSIDQLHTEANRICEAAYEKTKVNKNSCMEFMINPKSLNITAQAIMGVHAISSKVDERTIEIKRRQDEELRPIIIEASINHLKQAVIAPVILLFFGHAVAWIRRGFSQSNQA